VQRSAERNVDHLRAAADTQHGQACGQRRLEELQLELVALGSMRTSGRTLPP
jgi:hypothetical protein